MVNDVIQLLSSSSVEITTLVLAALPISELRGAIPYAVTMGGLAWQKAYIIAVIGNFLPVIPLLLFVGPVSERLRRYDSCSRFLEWLFKRTRKKGRVVERFEALGLIFFVAIPLPVTGAWTGTIAAFVFGIRKPLALPAIFCGICIAGAIVTLATLGVISFWGI